MKRMVALLAGLAALSALGAAAADEPITPREKIALFNGEDLAGWEFVLRPPKEGGIEVKPEEVWSVKEGLIACTGNPKGYMRTKVDYADYKLHVEWRWTGKGGNNGVLVHMVGEDKVWPKSLECQLMKGNAGDFFVIDGSEFKEHAAAGDRVKGRRTMKLEESNEKELGQWNQYDIVCDGATVTVTVNGLLQNKATECNLTSGKICLQSEGAPIEFRNVYIEPLD